MRTLGEEERIKKLTNEMEKYNWQFFGLTDIKWKNSEVQTEDDHAFYYSGEEEENVNCVGFLVNKSAKNTILGCQHINSSYIRLRAQPFNITLIHICTPTTDYSDDVI